ncbi:MAG: hypothetical protein JOZ54_24710, partial [Acidobacteria bacterium]|nr:hypothetical protein [Acidobacteriota bacterium]
MNPPDFDPQLERPILDATLDSAEELLEYLSPSTGLAHGSYYPKYLYRGLSCSSFPLVPSALRMSALLRVRDRELNEGWRTDGFANNAGQIAAEFEMLRLFVQQADRQGLLIPEDSQRFRELMRHYEQLLADIRPPNTSAQQSSG